jgi:hypothetical protein
VGTTHSGAVEEYLEALLRAAPYAAETMNGCMYVSPNFSAIPGDDTCPFFSINVSIARFLLSVTTAWAPLDLFAEFQSI